MRSFYYDKNDDYDDDTDVSGVTGVRANKLVTSTLSKEFGHGRLMMWR